MNSYWKNPVQHRKIKILILDAVLVAMVILMSYTFRIVVYEQDTISQLPARMTFLFPLAIVIHLVSFYVFGLYEIIGKNNKKLLFVNVFLSVASATLGIALLSYIFPEAKMGRILLGTHFFSMILVIYIWRSFFAPIFVQSSTQPVLLIGWNDLGKKIAQFISQATSGYKIEALMVLGPEEHPKTLGNPAPVYSSFDEAMSNRKVQTIVINKGIGPRNELKSKLVDIKFQGADIYYGPDFYKQMLGRIPAKEVSEDWLLYSSPTRPYRPDLYLHFKNVLDIVLSFTILFLSSPFLLLVAVFIKLDSKGPVLFTQERLGLYEKPFTLYKFRTMVVDAEKDMGPCWAGKNDTRFTRMGRILRKARLDEFPQFINVLKGDMSLVGPRPIRRYFADIFAEKFPFYRLRFKVKPGITGWAQVKMGYVNTDEDQYEKLEYELFYLYHKSLFLDALIVLKTVQSMLKMRGG